MSNPTTRYKLYCTYESPHLYIMDSPHPLSAQSLPIKTSTKIIKMKTFTHKFSSEKLKDYIYLRIFKQKERDVPKINKKTKRRELNIHPLENDS